MNHVLYDVALSALRVTCFSVDLQVANSLTNLVNEDRIVATQHRKVGYTRTSGLTVKTVRLGKSKALTHAIHYNMLNILFNSNFANIVVKGTDTIFFGTINSEVRHCRESIYGGKY